MTEKQRNCYFCMQIGLAVGTVLLVGAVYFALLG